MDDQKKKSKNKKVRHTTTYPGVIYYEVDSRVRKGEKDKVFYIYARVNGKLVEEKVGRQHEGTTAIKANNYLALRRAGKIKSPRERREEEKAAKLAKENRWTISRLWESYKQNRTIKGIKTDESRFTLYIKPEFGEKEPSEIAPLDVDRLRINLLKKKSQATVRNVLELLRRIINYGSKRNLCDQLSFKIEMPKVDNEVIDNLSPEQIARLFEAIDNSPHVIVGAMMKMALFTGMRRSEMLKLKWEHINEKDGSISLVDPKGGQKEEIPLNESARELINGLPRDSEFVFPGRNGRQRTDVKRGLDAIRKTAGLPEGFRPLHGLRHVFASMLANSGKVDLYTLQRLLTHKSPAMTMRYAHLINKTLLQASNLAGEIVNASVKKPAKIVKLKEAGE